MEERYGIIFLDGSELNIRIYLISNNQWKLVHYHQRTFLHPDEISLPPEDNISVAIAEFFSSTHAQHTAEWIIGVRHTSTAIIQQIQEITGCTVENLSKPREQELICKGLFTETW